MMIFIWIILGLFIYYMYKNNESLNINTQKTNSSMEVLKQRYVRGEIDDETFERMKKIMKE
ncbi:MAG: SHOCT domain-containing protein [Sedimentibacter sp.]